MDKKGTRSIQSSTKGLLVDSKKPQDGVTSKPWPKGGRRREPSAGTYTAKSESSRKLTLQRNRSGNDKRPRPRGFYYPNAGSGKEGARLMDESEAEVGSVFKKGSKKLNAINLCNFNYRSRNSDVHLGRYNGNKFGHGGYSIKHKYNKEEFLQANCQFIVKSSADYRQHMCNADILVDWNLIEQINIPGSFECPICLYPPVASKITRCGHVYCWSCMLHYLSLTDRSSRQCPICYEHVNKTDLKSATLIPQTLYKVNDTITFKLMKRQRGSLIVYHAADTIDESKTIFNMSEEKATNVYCKVLLANKQDIMIIIDRERTQLEVALAEDETSPERCFIEEALQILKNRENKLFMEIGLQNKLEFYTPDIINGIQKDQSDSGSAEHLSEHIGSIEKSSSCKRFESTSNTELPEVDSCFSDDLNSASAKSTKFPTKIFYFYQASDGQHIYIHPVNARMLEHTYRSLEFAPPEITGRILEKEEIVMTEEIRNRARYLQHLPLTCHFERAEIQLKYPTVSKETLKCFQGELENRKRERKYKAREEKRSERLWVEEENRIMGKIAEPKLCLTSPEEFPEFSDAMQIIAAEMAMSPSARTSISETYSTTPPSSSVLSTVGSLEKEYTGPSFAKMLSTSKKLAVQQQPWPEQKVENKEAIRLINVTGAKRESKFKPKVRQESDSEPECEGYVPTPRSSAMLADALSAALEKATVSSKDEGENLQSGKKKRKNKQKLLYTTSRGGFL